MAIGEQGSQQMTTEALTQDPPRLRREFWRKLKGVAARLPFAEDLVAVFYCAFDAKTPRHVQAMLLGALAYFVLPFDAVPDFLPLLGFGDDAAVLVTALRAVSSHIKPEHREAARETLNDLRASSFEARQRGRAPQDDASPDLRDAG